MNDRTAIVAEARAMIDTPFVHQARLPGVGLDCAGVLIAIGRRLGFVAPDFDVTGYPAAADGITLMEHLRRFLVPIEHIQAQAGDVGVYVWGGKHPHHVGVLVPYLDTDKLSLVHAMGPRRPARVRESRVLPAMRPVAFFAFPGVA